MTHPFHCCAFKFPSRHDPIKHAERIKNLHEIQQTCIAKGYPTNNIKTMNTNSDGTIVGEQTRIKRQLILMRLKRFVDLMASENKSIDIM